MDLNLNDTVHVRLSDVGRQWHRARHDAFWAGVAAEGIVVGPTSRAYEPPTEDADGWSAWQLHALFEAFGGAGIGPGFAQLPILAIRTDATNPGSSVRIPTNKDEAQLMVRLGAMWLREHEGEGVPR